ncbi:MAG: TIGR02453 family protein [Acidobacteria bacterium]|nr:MAG: TIGR02453 family protein [Acidobacteriota bacterium]
MKKGIFPGLPKEGLQFLRSLKRNNNREWFQKHMSIYETRVRQPMECLVTAMATEFEQFAPEMVASPKVSAYRIYRDIRFSKDKSPYKTHVAAVFPRSGLGKHEGAGYYLHLAPTELLIGGGLYMPLPEDLNAVRNHIAENAKAFVRIVEGRPFRRLFGSLGGEQLRRVPRGFSPDHAVAKYLRYKQFLASRTFDPDVATTAGFYKLVVETFRAMLPFIRFLNEPLIQARQVRDRQEALLDL